MRSFFLKYITRYLAVFCILLIVYNPYLKDWTLNGDELIVLEVGRNDSVKDFLKRFIYNGPGHYSPLIFALWKLYALLPSHFALIHLVNLALFALAPFLLLISLELLLPTILSILLTCILILSPIYYYHVYVISAHANTLSLVIFFLMFYLLLKTRKKPKAKYLYISLIFFLLSFFVRETFLINFFILLITANFYFKKNVKKTLLLIIPLGVIVLIFFYLRSKTLSQNNIYYSYIFNFYKLKDTVLFFTPWLFNYPAGWQYGVSQPPPFYYLFLVLSNIFITLGIYLYLYLKKPVVLFLILAGGVITLLPYFFLSRILVFYLDLTYPIWLLGIAYTLSLLRKRYARLTVITVIFIFFIQIFTAAWVIPQWVKHSFAGESNEIAKNFIKALQSAKIDNYQSLCITNHVKGRWPTYEGKLAKYFAGHNLDVISTPGQEVPDICLKRDSLILKNEGNTYFLLDI